MCDCTDTTRTTVSLPVPINLDRVRARVVAFTRLRRRSRSRRHLEEDTVKKSVCRNGARAALPPALVLAAALATGCSSGPATPAGTPSSQIPTSPAASVRHARSMVVIGHSGATGYNSDAGNPGGDATQNSWATGTNPAVDSIYQRLITKTPAYTDHAVNLAQDGATVADMIEQASDLATLQPSPDIVLVQGVDNDIRCDGTDPQNYAPFATSLRTLLRSIAEQLPHAKIFLLSVWGTERKYAEVIAHIPGVRAASADGSPCAPFDSAGKRRPQGIAYLQRIFDHYDNELANSCAAIADCHDDNGAMQHIDLVPADLTSDGNHLSVHGQRKYADLVWSTFFA
jgi:lysophospholipase L1-like esterase